MLWKTTIRRTKINFILIAASFFQFGKESCLTYRTPFPKAKSSQHQTPLDTWVELENNLSWNFRIKSKVDMTRGRCSWVVRFIPVYKLSFFSPVLTLNTICSPPWSSNLKLHIKSEASIKEVHDTAGFNYWVLLRETQTLFSPTSQVNAMYFVHFGKYSKSIA